MNTLSIDKSQAQKLFNETDTSGKNLLKALCGADAFITDITDRVKSYADACQVLGINGFSPSGTADEVAYVQLKTIIAALNEGWVPDWNDDEEYKFYPFWNMQNDFSLGGVSCNYRYSYVGSRLCFKSEKLAQYAADQFKDIYKQFYTV